MAVETQSVDILDCYSVLEPFCVTTATQNGTNNDNKGTAFMPLLLSAPDQEE